MRYLAFRRKREIVASTTLTAFLREQGPFAPRTQLTFSIYSEVESIDGFVRQELSKTRTYRMFNYKTDARKIQKYRDALQRSQALFGVGLKACMCHGTFMF